MEISIAQPSTQSVIETLPTELIFEVLSRLDKDADLRHVAHAIPNWSGAVMSVRSRSPPLWLMGKIEKENRQHFASQIQALELRSRRDSRSLRAFHGLSLPNVRTLRFDAPPYPGKCNAYLDMKGMREPATHMACKHMAPSTLWKERTFAPLRRCHNLERLEIHSWPFQDIDILDFVLQCHKLKWLRMGFRRPDDESTTPTTKIFEALKMTHIQSFFMDNGSLASSDVLALLALFPGDLAHIRHIRFRSSADPVVFALVDKFLGLQSLEITLDCHNTFPVPRILHSLHGLKRLSLSFSGKDVRFPLRPTFIGFWDVQQVFNLEKLQIVIPILWMVDSARDILSFQKVLPNLVDLRLVVRGIDAAFLRVIGLNCPNLRCLVVNSDKIELDPLETVEGPLFPALTKLALSRLVPETAQWKERKQSRFYESAILFHQARVVAHIITRHAPKLAQSHEFITNATKFGCAVYDNFQRLVKTKTTTEQAASEQAAPRARLAERSHWQDWFAFRDFH